MTFIDGPHHCNQDGMKAHFVALLRKGVFQFITLIVLAKYQACHGDSLPAETTICIAGPGGNPFFDINWLAVEEVNQQKSGTAAPQHSPSLTYLPNLQTALKSHMHSNHKLGYATQKQGTTLITRVCFHTSTKA